MWKIQKIISKGEYNYAVVKNHPNAGKYGYVLEHRIIMENYLGRLLNPNEVVHHINSNKKDNRIENLELMTCSEHARKHAMQRGRKYVELKCPECYIIFNKPKNKTFLQKKNRYTCCSIRCRDKFSRKIKLYGITHAIEKAISENIVRLYISYDHYVTV